MGQLYDSLGLRRTGLKPAHTLDDSEIKVAFFEYVNSNPDVQIEARESKNLSARDIRQIYKRFVIAESIGVHGSE